MYITIFEKKFYNMFTIENGLHLLLIYRETQNNTVIILSVFYVQFNEAILFQTIKLMYIILGLYRTYLLQVFAHETFTVIAMLNITGFID